MTRRSTGPPRDAAAGPPEKLAYVATFARPADKPDAIAVVDTDPGSAAYGSVTGFTELPNLGDELHHYGRNACSSALWPDRLARPRRPALPGRPRHPLLAHLHPRHPTDPGAPKVAMDRLSAPALAGPVTGSRLRMSCQVTMSLIMAGMLVQIL